jgi:hypothetical protein
MIVVILFVWTNEVLNKLHKPNCKCYPNKGSHPCSKIIIIIGNKINQKNRKNNEIKKLITKNTILNKKDFHQNFEKFVK